MSPPPVRLPVGGWRPSRSELMADSAVIGALCVVVAAVQEVRGVPLVFSDIGTMFLPNYSWWWQEWRLLGGWNPWIFAGYPAGGDPLVGAIHPLGLLYAFFPPLVALACESVLAPAVGGVGMMLYLRRIGSGRLGATLAGLVFAFGGWSTGHSAHLAVLRSTMFAPWALLAIEALRGRRLVAGLGLALALMVAGGHPQTILLLLVVVSAYALLFGPSRSATGMLCLIGTALLGGALSAPGWLPAIQLISESTRSLGLAAVGVVSPRVAAVDFWGLLTPLGPRGEVGFGRCSPVECSVYDGAALWVLVVMGAAQVFPSGRGRFWAVLALLGAFLSTGPLDAAFLEMGMRGASRFLIWFHLAAAALVGIAVGQGPVRAGPLGVVGVLALALAVIVPSVAWPALWAATFLLALAFAARVTRGNSRAARWLVVAVFAADLLAFRALQMSHNLPRQFEEKGALVHTGEILRSNLGVAGARDRVLHVPLAILPNWAAVERVALVQGYNTLVWRRLIALLDSGGQEIVAEQALVADEKLAGDRNHALDLLRTRLVVVHESARDPLSAAIRKAGSARWVHRTTTDAGTEVFENLRTLPVAWLVPEVLPVEDDTALARIHGTDGAGGFDPYATALVEPRSMKGALTNLRGTGATGTVDVHRYEDDRLVLDTDAPEAALLVTTELAYPGWRVLVDGQPAELIRANTAFRAVFVPAGAHRVEFVYRPLGVRVGIGLALLGLVALIVLLLPYRKESQD